MIQQKALNYAGFCSTIWPYINISCNLNTLATHFDFFTKEIDFASLKSINWSDDFTFHRKVSISWTWNHLLSSRLCKNAAFNNPSLRVNLISVNQYFSCVTVNKTDKNVFFSRALHFMAKFITQQFWRFIRSQYFRMLNFETHFNIIKPTLALCEAKKKFIHHNSTFF